MLSILLTKMSSSVPTHSYNTRYRKLMQKSNIKLPTKTLLNNTNNTTNTTITNSISSTSNTNFSDSFTKRLLEINRNGKVYINTLTIVLKFLTDVKDKRIKLNTLRFIFDYTLSYPEFINKKLFDVLVMKLKQFRLEKHFTTDEYDYYLERLDKIKVQKKF